MDKFEEMECWFLLRRNQQILLSDVLEDPQHTLFQSALCELAINLSDLAKIAEQHGHEIPWSDNDTPNGVADHLRVLRGCFAHPRTGLKNMNKTGSRFSMNVADGPYGIVIDGWTLSERQGEIAVGFGQRRFYIHRHLARAHNSLVEIFQEWIPEQIGPELDLHVNSDITLAIDAEG